MQTLWPGVYADAPRAERGRIGTGFFVVLNARTDESVDRVGKEVAHRGCEGQDQRGGGRRGKIESVDSAPQQLTGSGQPVDGLNGTDDIQQRRQAQAGGLQEGRAPSAPTRC